MEEYLVPAFLGNQIFKKKNKAVEGPELESLTRLLNRKRNDDEVHLLNECIRTHRFLSEIDSTHSIDIPPSELVQKCIMSLSLLTKYFLVASDVKNNSENDLEVLRFWREFWYQPPSVIEFFNQITENQQSLDITKSNYIFGLYKESFDALSTFVKEQDEKDRIFSVTYNDLTVEDCKKLDEVRNSWYHRDYFDASFILAQYLEEKIRQTIFNIFLLLYNVLSDLTRACEKEFLIT